MKHWRCTMSSKITGKEYPLLKIFSFDFEYHTPAYQRPHAWITEEAGILFDDLYDFTEQNYQIIIFLAQLCLLKRKTNHMLMLLMDSNVLLH